MLKKLIAGQPVGRGRTMLTGAAPWYNVYETADGKYVALGPVEPWFYVELCNIPGRPERIPHQRRWRGSSRSNRSQSGGNDWRKPRHA